MGNDVPAGTQQGQIHRALIMQGPGLGRDLPKEEPRPQTLGRADYTHVNTLRTEVLSYRNLFPHSVGHVLFLKQPQVVWVLIKILNINAVLNIHVQPLVIVMDCPDLNVLQIRRTNKWSCALSLPCLVLVAVSYLNKPLQGVFHALERSTTAIISGIRGVLKDSQAHRVLAACELN